MPAPSINSPLVSIVLPTYNRAALIGRSLRSLLNQSFEDFEVLVVDDASADDTEQVVRGHDDPRIRYLRLTANGGPAVACNHGVRHSRGEFVSFQGSDDAWLPQKLEKQLKAFFRSEPGVGVVTCDMLRIHLDGSSSYLRAPATAKGRRLDPRTGYYQTRGLGSQATLIRRSCLDSDCPFDERFRCFEDLELLLRLAQQFEFEHVPEALVHYYESADSATRLWSDRVRARKLLLRANLAPLVKENPAFVLREFALQCGATLFGGFAREIALRMDRRKRASAARLRN